MKNNAVSVISIDGSIGAGKSTVISHLNKNDKNDFIYLPEPILEYNLLDKFYKDKKSFAAQLQFQILASQYDQYVKCYNSAPSPSILITERSPSASIFVFAQMLIDMNFFDRKWLDIYKLVSKRFYYEVDFYIYLDISPQISYERIQTRGRYFEKDIDVQYLEALYNQYRHFYNNLPTEKYVNINASDPIDVVVQKVNSELNRLKNHRS